MTIQQKFMARVLKLRGRNACWLWTGPRGKRPNKNYGLCHLIKGQMQAHRVSYILFKGPIPAGLQVLHSCDNPPCVRPKHIRAGTAQDNVDDREKRGRAHHHSGEKHGRAKLTWDLVRKIRRDCITGLKPINSVLVINSVRFLTQKYGVGESTIRHLLKGDTWKES